MGKKTIVDMGRKIQGIAREMEERIFSSGGSERIEKFERDVKQAHQSTPAVITIPANWQKTAILQGDEGVVKMSVVDRIQEAAEDAEWWAERGGWNQGILGAGVREYIERLEAEVKELRAMKLGGLEDLT